MRDDLPYQYEKLVLAHELRHVLLHIEVTKSAYNSKLINRGKLEKQADYFALKLLDISIDEISYEGYTQEQIAEDLYITERSINYF
ncbi:ImmA/IrrE family metallo-endopeptidase [Tissierella sp. MB52-C2]|uniref:ImmA/IrrE family metallo-endopeptidase n=1 Tax=Tissierella sp. MB52-C2 TaxID=3070999 RepID=UPI0035AB7E5E